MVSEVYQSECTQAYNATYYVVKMFTSAYMPPMLLNVHCKAVHYYDRLAVATTDSSVARSLKFRNVDLGWNLDG